MIYKSIKYRCADCGMVYREEDATEYRRKQGEFWETYYGCPNWRCRSEYCEEIYDDEEEDDEEEEDDYAI